MADTLVNNVCLFAQLILKQLDEVGTFVILILQMRQKHREVK